MSKKKETHEVVCLVCDWKGLWKECTVVPVKGARVMACPHCPDGILVTAEELGNKDEFWAIHQEGYRKEVERRRKRWREKSNRSTT